MKRRRFIGAGTALVLGLALVVGLPGCSNGGTEGSRAKLYYSVSELAQDSSVIVIGTARGHWVTADLANAPDLDFTLTNVTVEQVVKSDIVLAANDLLIVRQVPEGGSGSPPILTTGQRYLLYLSHSGLAGDQASQFYITGASAGIYVAASPDAPAFTRVVPDSGDTLPDSVSIDTALG